MPPRCYPFDLELQFSAVEPRLVPSYLQMEPQGPPVPGGRNTKNPDAKTMVGQQFYFSGQTGFCHKYLTSEENLFHEVASHIELLRECEIEGRHPFGRQLFAIGISLQSVDLTIDIK